MTKKLPTNDIANELSGASVFFQSQSAVEPAIRPHTPERQQVPEQTTPQQEVIETPMTPRHRDTTTPRSTDIETADKNDNGIAHDEGYLSATTLEKIRKEVRQLGKEAATHRFRTQEKMALGDIVYTYTRQGYKTSENEITRIAVNWLLLDYQENGEHSVLARVLESIHR